MPIDLSAISGRRPTGGDAIVAWLKSAGVEHLFSVSGGPINSVYRACAEMDLPLVHTRHEAAACFMAEAASRVTGKAGAAIVTLGPGVTNTVTPAMVAKMAGTPLLIIGAQAGTGSLDRGAGMSYDVLPAMAAVTKWSARVIDAARLPEYLDMAWRHIWAGRPGPVFLEVPTDILSAAVEAGLLQALPDAPPTASAPGLSGADGEAIAKAFCEAKRPLLLLGDEVFWHLPERALEAIERHHLPFATMRLARGVVDERHPLWAGPGYAPCNPTLRRALGEADCILLLGHHFEFDLEFGKGLGEGTKVIQSSADAELLHRSRRADIAANASARDVLAMLAELPALAADKAWVDGVTAGWAAERDAQAGEGGNDGMHPVAAVDAVCDGAPDNAIFVSSHGNVDFWADARLRFSASGRYLRAGQSGSLGAEVPYGVGASFADPQAPAIVFVGDGGVGYHVTELDTAERHGRNVIIVVLDDQLWGAIALPQRQSFGETYAMDLPRRDWAKVAEGLGATGVFCADPASLRSAIAEAAERGGPTLIHVPVRSVISPYMAYIS
ncbi:thiamine pyrophosphate-binding protein [Afifella sp. IM 167]|uniref:thiamine pyrophosphate-binding protein n=1 Tax=Afifella sp. IM 167 TaxID=2033586 RepID=UPI001CC9D0C8